MDQPSPSPSPTPLATPKPTGKPGTAANTNGSAAGISNRFGLSVGNTLPGLSASVLARQLDDMKALGIGWIRLDFDWNDIQPEGPNQFEWQRHDAIVAAAASRGLKLLPILTYTAPWARQAACRDSFTCAPANPDQFANFAQATVQRYSSRGIHHWEIWNEPNTDGAWGPKASASGFAQLLKSTYPRIKQADPGAVVISGGLASSDGSDGVPQLDYLKALYAAGAKNYFNAVGYHPYSFPVPPSYIINWNAWTKMGLTSTSLRSIMAANGDSAKQIWVTEFGAPTNGPRNEATPQDYKIDGSPDHVNEALQSVIAADMVNSVRTTPWIGASFWYSYQDQGTNRQDTEDFYGLRRADGSAKPAYNELRRLLTR